jgi:MFS family permease
VSTDVAPTTGTRGWISRNLLILCGVSFLQDAASELLYPILPIFLTVSLGAPPAAVGAVEGVAEGVASVTRLVAGRLGDRRARKPLIAVGYGLAAIGKVVIALAGIWPVVLVGRAVDRVGKGIRGAPRDALLVVGVPAAARGRAFGLHRAADTAGAVAGPLLGLAGYELLHHHIRPLLAVAVVPAIASVLLVSVVREGAPQAARSASNAAPLRLPDLPTSYRRVVGLLAVFAVVNFPDTLVLLRLHDIGFGLVAVIAVYAAYNAVYALLSYPLGALSDRAPRRLIFAGGLVAFSACYLGLGLTRNHLAAWILLVVYGAFTAATDGVGKAWASQLAGPDRQAGGQGIFQATQGGGILVAGLWAGFAWHGDGHIPLLVSGAAAAILAAVLALWRVDGSSSVRAGRPG